MAQHTMNLPKCSEVTSEMFCFFIHLQIAPLPENIPNAPAEL